MRRNDRSAFTPSLRTGVIGQRHKSPTLCLPTGQVSFRSRYRPWDGERHHKYCFQMMERQRLSHCSMLLCHASVGAFAIPCILLASFSARYSLQFMYWPIPPFCILCWYMPQIRRPQEGMQLGQCVSIVLDGVRVC